jgi:hypothetical protein
MKVLLLGDYSSMHVNLKSALIELGHICHLATSGDGFKKTSKSDLFFPYSRKPFIRFLKIFYFLLIAYRNYKNYDVVQLINSDVFGLNRFGFNKFIIKKIKKQNGKLFLSACGTDYFVYNSRYSLHYNPYDSYVKIDLDNYNPYNKKHNIDNNKSVIKLVNKIIPSMYSYTFPYNWTSKLSNTIPLPIDVKKISFLPQTFLDGKIVIFHGINRRGFKGSIYIEQALKKIQEKYSERVKIIIDGNLPLKDYLYALKKTNIIVDQCLSYDYGMNALYGMALGKVVLSGNETESQKHFNRSNIPVINILPSVEDIYNKLEFLILNPNKIIEIGQKSRLFVEDFHDSIKIAKEYLKIWSS